MYIYICIYIYMHIYIRNINEMTVDMVDKP